VYSIFRFISFGGEICIVDLLCCLDFQCVRPFLFVGVEDLLSRRDPVAYSSSIFHISNAAEFAIVLLLASFIVRFE
jgi:hypothetical protein